MVKSSNAGEISSASPEQVPTQAQGQVHVTVKALLDAGAHFGHQTQRWNPKMLPYIYTERNGIHVINLDLTLKLWQRARKFIVETISRGGTMLLVATKAQAREIMAQEAQRCGAFHVCTRWLGGMLTNFDTIKASIDRMKKLEDYLARAEVPDSQVKLKKKEKLTIARQVEKLNDALGGIRDMRRRPDVIFVIDLAKEAIAIAEARRLHIPVIALVDTNVDPSRIEFPVPSNDDAARTIQLFAAAVADAVIEGKREYEMRRPKEDHQGGSNSRRGGSHASNSNNAPAAAPVAVATTPPAV